MNDVRYPTGRFESRAGPLAAVERTRIIGCIPELPAQARTAVSGLTDAHLATPHRDGGWAPRQIVHHLADSHMNGFMRVKLALTEERPTITPCDETAWATLPDVASVPVAASLAILDGLRERWVCRFEAMSPTDFGRAFIHPEIGDIDVDYLLQDYGWHGLHHVTQITELHGRQAW